MRTLTSREKRTIRIGGIGIAIYLGLFGGFKAWRFAESKRAAYDRLVKEATDLRNTVLPYQQKALIVDKLMKEFQMDPLKLSRPTLVADASAAVQQAAMSGGIQLGPVRESPGRVSTRELASVQFEGVGTVPAAMSLLHRLQSLGYPLVIDSVQITPETRQRGRVKLNFTVVILDFDQQKAAEVPHA